MRKYKFTVNFFIIIVTLFLSVFFGPIILVHADVNSPIHAYDFNDGISNWSLSSTNSYSQIDIGTYTNGQSLKLGYAFGLAQSTNGRVSDMGDNIVRDSEAPTINNIYYSKMNVFLNANGNYISSAFQQGYKYNNSASEGVSPTSPDFMLIPSDSTKVINSRDFSILGTSSRYTNNNGNPGLTNKKFYFAHVNGHMAYKIMGNYVRTSGGVHNGEYNMEVELLLRPSPTNSAIVQRELYVKNLADQSVKFTTLFSEDTKLGDSNGGQDNVPIYNLGNGKGLYIDSDYNGNNYKLMVTNNLPDGFKYYSGQKYITPTMNWASGFTKGLITGTGAENGKKDESLLGVDFTGLPISADSSYSLKWSPTTISSGQTAHFGSTIGVTSKPFSIPTAEKTYENETRFDGTNKVNDNLKFNLKITNNGYGAKWRYDKLTDQIPDGLQVDPSSLRVIDDNGLTQIMDPSNYDTKNNQINISPALVLTDNQSAIITFKAQITKKALTSGNIHTITNTATFTGVDIGNSETTAKNFFASVDIKVEPSDYDYTFSKLVKKHGDTNYTDVVSAKKGDIVDYQIIYGVNDGSKENLQGGSVIDDILPAGIELDPSSIRIWGPSDKDESPGYTQSHLNTGYINAMIPNQRVKIQFSAKVTGSSVGTLTNIATITGVTTTGGQYFDSQNSTNADVEIKNIDSFTEAPKEINFGTTHLLGKDKIVNNINTLGKLTIAHPDQTPYSVTIAYDNSVLNLKRMVNGNGDTLPADDSGLLFIRQRNNNYTDVGRWVAITPTGTSIRSSPFTNYGSAVDLTNYVGADDWQIKIASNAKTGIYHGTLTWGLIESI